MGRGWGQPVITTRTIRGFERGDLIHTPPSLIEVVLGNVVHASQTNPACQPRRSALQGLSHEIEAGDVTTYTNINIQNKQIKQIVA